MKRKGTFLVGLAATVAGAALLPAVAAAQSPNDRATHGVGAIVLEQSTSAVRPDDRATHGVGSTGSLDNAPSATPSISTYILQHHLRDGVRGPGTFESTPTTTVVTSSPNTFDWGDASIGALGGLGLALCIGGIAILTTRRLGAGVAVR